MRNVTLILLLVAATVCDSKLTNHITRDYVEKCMFQSGLGQKLQKFLEDLKTKLKTGDSTIGIPKLDPFKLEHYEFDIQEDQISIQGQVEDVFVQGLSEYDIQFVDMKMGRWNLTIDLRWNEVRAKTKYNVNGEAMEKAPVYGKGDLDAEVNNFNFVSEIQLKVDLKNKKAEILEVKNTTISLDKLKLDVTGFLNNEDLSAMFSKVMSDMAPKFVKDFQEEITIKVNKLIKEKGNEFIKSMDLSSILGGVIG